MAQHSRRFIVIYDITEDRERKKTSDLLERLGTRVQKSAFVVRLTKGRLEQMTQELEALSLATGWVEIYRVDETWKTRRIGSERSIAPKDTEGNTAIAVDQQHAFIL